MAGPNGRPALDQPFQHLAAEHTVHADDVVGNIWNTAEHRQLSEVDATCSRRLAIWVAIPGDREEAVPTVFLVGGCTSAGGMCGRRMEGSTQLSGHKGYIAKSDPALSFCYLERDPRSFARRLHH